MARIRRLSNEEIVEIVRNWLIENIFRNGYIMHDDNIRSAYNPEGKNDEDNCIDLAEVISGLYELLHGVIENERYDYMFHWANKCGSWVECDFFLKMIREKEEESDNAEDHKAEA